MALLRHILPRQVTNSNDGNDNSNDNLYPNDGWYSTEAYVIKWAVIVAIFFACLFFFLGGYLHAKRRMKHGKPPLAYHRWMIPHRTRLAFHAQHPELPNPYPPAQYTYYGGPAPYRPGYGDARGHNYPMGPVYNGPPPPAYAEPEWVPPYAPPEGGSKVAPNQNVVSVQGEGQGSGSHPGGDLGRRQLGS